MDYVCCWYKKAWQLIKGTSTQAALVSTNSICQGEQVANLWKPMMEDGLRINFAHRTFRWDSEASQKAHVHCVIVGFGNKSNTECHLYDNDKISKVAHINAYLMEAPDVFVGSRQHPIFDVPEIGIGNKPIDGGNYLFDKEEMEDFVTFSRRSHYTPFNAGFMHEKVEHYAFGNHEKVKVKIFKVPATNIEKIKDYIQKIEGDPEYIFNIYSITFHGDCL